MSSPRQPAGAGGAEQRWQSRRVFLIGLTAAAGWLDALAFLHLGKVFISFMSGNILFVGMGAGEGNGGLVVRAGAVLVAFFCGTVAGARITGSRLVPGVRSPLPDALLLEGCLLAAFAALWLVTGRPDTDAATTLALLVLGALAMGIQAAIALALHLPNIATVALTATFAQLGALLGWREREGHAIVLQTPPVSLMIPLCLAYLISALIVAAVPERPGMALVPVLLLAVAVATEELREARGLTPAGAHGR